MSSEDGEPRFWIFFPELGQLWAVVLVVGGGGRSHRCSEHLLQGRRRELQKTIISPYPRLMGRGRLLSGATACTSFNTALDTIFGAAGSTA